MSKIMLVNVTHVEESRVAVLDDGVLAQYEIETINRTNIKGNIHNAVVENVHPSLEAAFVKIGPDLKGFLPLDEVNFKLLPVRGESRGRGKIGQHLHPGQKLMVQVIREPFAGKPPTVTTYFSLPGRYLVLMPGVDSAGISRKIEDSEQRDRLKKMVEELDPPEGFGLIVRTAGVGQSRVELQRDLRYLLRLWESIQRASRGGEFPGRVYRERDLVIRTIRDYFTPDIDEVWIDSQETYERALEFVGDVMPSKAKIVRLYTGDRPLFSKFNLEDQIESIYKRRVPLPSGGEIVIDGTEALTAIDVNSARSSRQGDAEENATQTNIEASAEIARQLRLRDLGGLVVIDFIDMMAARNQKKVEKAIKDAMKGDKAKVDITRISKLGLLEISRQRIKGEKLGASYTTCPSCEGYGLVKNVESAALSALRKLQARTIRTDFGKIRMGVPPEICVWILNNKREDLLALEKRNQIRISVEPKGSLLRHESEFEFFPREKVEVPPALVAPDRPVPPTPPDLKEMEEPAATPAALPTTAGEPAAVAAGDGEPQEQAAGTGRRRRRRRRRGRGRGGEAVAQPQGPNGSPEPVEASDATGFDLVADEEGNGEIEVEFDGEQDEMPSQADGAPSQPGGNGASGEGGGRRRRRRRRRRGRGRGGAPMIPGQEGQPEGGQPHQVAAPDEPGAPMPRERDEAPVVPSNVRAEELMPAATGGRRSRGASMKFRFRRRRGGGAGNGEPGNAE